MDQQRKIIFFTRPDRTALQFLNISVTDLFHGQIPILMYRALCLIQLYKKPFVFLQNGWFLTRSVQAGSELIVGLLRIRSDYGLENDIIKNGFVKHFRIPDNTGFSRNKNASEYQIFSSDGTFLFSLLYPG